MQSNKEDEGERKTRDFFIQVEEKPTADGRESKEAPLGVGRAPCSWKEKWTRCQMRNWITNSFKHMASQLATISIETETKAHGCREKNLLILPFVKRNSM